MNGFPVSEPHIVHLYSLPLLYGVANVRYASIQQFTGDVWGDAFLAAGGISLITISTLLFVRHDAGWWDMSAWFGWLGHAGIAIAMCWLALLSRRMGRVTQSPPYYIGLLISSAIVAISPIAQLTNLISGINVEGATAWSLVYNGLPALGLTVGLFFAWRYWSWLFAERD